MNKTIKDLKVGDVVWYTDVNVRDRETGELKISSAVVSKVGSKLIHVTSDYHKPVSYRADTLIENGDYNHRTLILDLDDYSQARHKAKLLKAIRNVYYTDSSYEDVIEAARLLGIK